MSARHVFTACLLAGGLLNLARPVWARQAPDELYGRTVTALRFEVDGQLDASAALANLVDVKVGQPLTRDGVHAAMDRLFSIQRYDDIRPSAAPSPGGVIVTFRLVPRYPIDRVDIPEGDTGVSTSALRDELRQRFGGVPTGVRLETVEDALKRFLNDEGFLDADVSAQTKVNRNTRTATLVLTVEAGPLATIHRTEVKGRSPLTAADVIARTETGPGRPYHRRAIDLALTGIEDDLRERDYYEAEATVSAIRTPEGMDLVVSLEAGPRVVLSVEPESALPGKKDELIPIKRERSADQDLLEDSRDAILRVLRREGYADAVVTVPPRELSSDGATLTVRFRIDRGPRYYVDHVEIPEGASLSSQTMSDLLRIQAGAVFDPDAFASGLVRVIEEYRRLGYYKIESHPERETVSGRTTSDQAWVVLHPNIIEGPRGQVTKLTFDFTGAHQISEADLRGVMRSRVDRAYASLDTVLDQDAMLTFYRERGFLNAAVGLKPDISNDGRDVALTVTVTEGPQIIVAKVTVVGNERVSESRILEAIGDGLRVGRPLAASALSTARQHLVNLGVFSNVSILPEDRLSGETEARIVVSVAERPDLSVGFGGGLEGQSQSVLVNGVFEDQIDLSPRGFFEIGRRNLGGKNRSINFFSRVSFRRKDRVGDGPADAGLGFTEYRVTTTYREQRVFSSDTELVIGLTSEQAIRTTYKFLRRSATSELLHHLDQHVSVSGRYVLEFTRLFDERIDINDQPLIDRLFPQVRLSYFATGISWEGRDSILTPTRGLFIAAEGEVASRALASEVGYVKGYFQASKVVRVGGTARNVFAMRGALGLARGLARTVLTVDPSGESRTDVVSDLPVSQRFFAGGSTTVRGFQLDRLGVYDPLCTTRACSVIDPETGLAVGGNGLVVLNVELRRVVSKLFSRNFAVAGFLDGGNVFSKASDIDLARLRGAVGFGVRYDSPLGPMRLDFGFKLNRLTIAGQRESGWEYHLSLGEAF